MSCWGCLEGTCKWIPRHFSPKIIKKKNSDVPQVQETLLTSFVELRSWGFFDGSIDSVKYSCNFHWDFEGFLYYLQF
jgi:hypothetical protein